MPQCCFAGCHNRTDDGRGLSFFRFPRRDQIRTSAWVEACGRRDFAPSQHSRVCSRHFSAIDFERDARAYNMGEVHRRLRLKDTAVPTKDPINNPWQDTEIGPLKRNQRIQPASTDANKNVISKNGSDSSTMCTPAKRVASEVDVLDLSRNSCSPSSPLLNGNYHSRNSDVIVLSEDDDEKVSPSTSDTEKENTPLGKNSVDGKSLILRLENELRQEEYTLLLLQKILETQKSNVNQPSSRTTTKPSAPAAQYSVSNAQNGSHASTAANNAQLASVRSIPASQPSKVPQQSPSPANSPISAPKVTKAAALQSLEQQCNAKKSVLKKQLERSLEKVHLPRPTTGTGLCEIAFIPSTLTSDFTALLGLEEVVRTMQDFDPSVCGGQSEPRRIFDPFSCVRCGVDFTPVWKREKTGSTKVICEACLAGNQRSSLQKEYEESVKQAMQQYTNSERDIEREYQDIVTTPAKLDAYIREQEKKLLATHQAQLLQQQQQLAQQQAAAQAHSQRYQAKQLNTQSNSGMRVPNQGNATSPASMATTHQRSRQSNSTPLANSPVSTSAISATVPQQHLSSVTQHLASAYQQQLSKVNATGSQVNTAALVMAAANPALLAAAASNQQQQQQQQQQRLAAAVISGLQQQQQAQTQPNANDQFAQLQALFVNSLILSGSAGSHAAGNSRQQLIQQAMQYSLLLQQQQQQAAAAQQAQQQAAAAAAHQNAALAQILSAMQSSPATYLNLIQNLWAMNAANNSAGGLGSGNNNKK